MNSHESQEDNSVITALLLESCKCHYDLDTAIGHITYSDQITPEITEAVYQWMEETLRSLPEGHQTRGCIFDFTAVERTSSSNISTANTRGKSFRKENRAVYRIPTALIVRTLYQELLVETMMKLAQHSRDDKNSHIRVVRTYAEAIAFIDGWHQ